MVLLSIYLIVSGLFHQSVFNLDFRSCIIVAIEEELWVLSALDFGFLPYLYILLLFFLIIITIAISTTTTTIMEVRKPFPETITVAAKPYGYTFPTASTALLMIDMQRDFLLPDGFGDLQSGSNLTAVKSIIPKCAELLETFRMLDLPIFHTREGHLPDLSDCPSSKTVRQAATPGTGHSSVIGDAGKMGALLVRGEYGHDLVDDCKAKPWEIVIDKPGKGAFWNTTLHEQLIAWGITHLIVGGVTTECCVTTTVREANDRGFECCKLEPLLS